MNLERLLLVDDEPDIRAVAAISLEKVGGFQLDCASDGPAALAQARQTRPDLILLDVMMPGMTGLEVLAELRADEALATIPVVFMTAKVQQEEIESYLEAGALGVITKPFDPMGLPGELRALVAGLK